MHAHVMTAFGDEMTKIAFTPSFNAKVISSHIDRVAQMGKHTAPAYATRAARVAAKNVSKSQRNLARSADGYNAASARPTTKRFGAADANRSMDSEHWSNAIKADTKARALVNP